MAASDGLSICAESELSLGEARLHAIRSSDGLARASACISRTSSLLTEVFGSLKSRSGVL